MKPPRLRSATLSVSILASTLVAATAATAGGTSVGTVQQPEVVEQELLELVKQQRTLLDGLPADERERLIAELIERLRAPVQEPAEPVGESNEVREAPPAEAAPTTVTRTAAASEPAEAPTVPPVTRPNDPGAAAEPAASPAPTPAEPAATATTAEAPLTEPPTAPASGPAPPWAKSDAAARLSPRTGDVEAPTASDEVEAETEAPQCNTLVPFDSGGDGRFSAADRNWRHFYLWNDLDGDEVPVADELTSLFDAGVRSIGMDLRVFEGLDDLTGRIDHGTYLVLRSPKARTRGAATSGRLVVDLDDLVRSTPLLLQDADGTSLQGIQPLRAGLEIVTVEGGATKVDCP